ncbi:class A beta-lactamase-related serine hydrolase [Dyadobacter sp. CY345]|uniref:serine hydrolase n=1 Tax=Dyadobacter sp. CY345 TaxID=2909335 RepID=UPI001F437EF1|nr:serine hydrolase [Dyadobacter sp. CY345]MCF2443855.1 class A beta-lactamase-related serine hydrolase [Dyadobacter sp. CY345]
MKHLCLWVVLICFVKISALAQPKQNICDLRQKISTELQKHTGTYAVAFKDLATGESLLINESESFHAASTMKTPVMVEVFKQAAEGKFALTDSIIIKNEFKSIVDGSLYSLDSIQDSDHLLYRKIGQKRAIKDLVYEMIIVSSNFATNIIIDLVGAENVSKTMKELGAKDIQILRGVEDAKAYQKGLNNTTTANDLRILFEGIAAGKIVDQKSCDAMIKILLDQKFNDVIPGKLPKEVKVAHKTGSISKVYHDSGIIFLPDGKKYVLVLLSKGWDEEKTTKNMLAEISEMIYLHLK